MKIGVFGGTFDPPHLAHLILADEACSQLGLECVLWVLTPDPPHKQGQLVTPLEDRLLMVEAALADNPLFILSRIEIDRPAPHYALDTVRLLKAQKPGSELIYLIGSDSLRDLPTWHRPRDFVEACHSLGVMQRPDVQIDLAALETKIPGLLIKLRLIHAPLIEISASQIRQRISQEAPYRYYLPPGVYKIIQERGLYRPKSVEG
jgi:nicotinate-nucleotide adenylyltransferase